MTLPKPKISVFSGDPVEYSDFASVFENLIAKEKQPELTFVLSQSIYVRRSEGGNAKLFIDGS